jgi:OOP family OmpA-OmpF porin
MTGTARVAFAGALLLGLVSACAKNLPEEPPLAVSPLTASGTLGRITDDVIVVTDASGTIHDASVFPTAKSLTRTFIAGMPDANIRSARPGPYQAGSIAFGGEERVRVAIAPFDRAALAAAAAGLTPLGEVSGRGATTPLHDVMQEASADLTGHEQRAAVVIFSDGLADDPAATVDAAKLLVASYRGEACIHTVQIGSEEEGKALLETLAAISKCGSFRNAESLRTPQAFMDFEKDVFLGDVGGGKLVLRGVNFDFDKSNIRPDAAVILDEAASLLRTNSGWRVSVDGHTDSTGGDSYNQGLSQRRAESVKRYLVGKGIAESRLVPRGYGESQPVASNSTRDGRALNRRVELKVLD